MYNMKQFTWKLLIRLGESNLNMFNSLNIWTCSRISLNYRKEVILCFLGFAFPLLHYVHIKGGYFLPKKTLLPHSRKRFVNSQVFTSATNVRHYVTPL